MKFVVQSHYGIDEQITVTENSELCLACMVKQSFKNTKMHQY